MNLRVRHMRLLPLSTACLASLQAIPVQAFDPADLQGVWAESNRSHYACTPTNRRQRLALSSDGKTLSVTTELKSKTHAPDVVTLDVTRTDEHSLYLRFRGHEGSSDPLAGEWALSMLGPGVYRWHLASEHEGNRPAPIGVRCAP